MMNNEKCNIPVSALNFLEKLKANNNRDWFNAHKEEFVTEQGFIEDYASALLHKLSAHDVIETVSGKKSLYRIYRDTRFSKDKTPYKSHWSGSFKRAGKTRRGGYYYHIEKGNSFIAGGFWGPSAGDLKMIRDEIAFDPESLREIIHSESFKTNFGELLGTQLKTTPKGFEATHPAIDLLRYKQFLLIRKFDDAEVLSDSFVDTTTATFLAMRPFFDYMSNALSSDPNGC